MGIVMGSEKNGEYVDCPISGFDITDYLLGEKEGRENGERFVYDLYGVSNHMGSLYGGHYTAYAYNTEAGQWFNFDDSHVSRASESKVIGTSSYILFYRRRETNQVAKE